MQQIRFHQALEHVLVILVEQEQKQIQEDLRAHCVPLESFRTTMVSVNSAQMVKFLCHLDPPPAYRVLVDIALTQDGPNAWLVLQDNTPTVIPAGGATNVP